MWVPAVPIPRCPTLALCFVGACATPPAMPSGIRIAKHVMPTATKPVVLERCQIAATLALAAVMAVNASLQYACMSHLHHQQAPHRYQGPRLPHHRTRFPHPRPCSNGLPHREARLAHRKARLAHRRARLAHRRACLPLPQKQCPRHPASPLHRSPLWRCCLPRPRPCLCRCRRPRFPRLPRLPEESAPDC
eukprot:jgi/Botrbrau1/14224/Bobra.0254s0013.1